MLSPVSSFPCKHLSSEARVGVIVYLGVGVARWGSLVEASGIGVKKRNGV